MKNTNETNAAQSKERVYYPILRTPAAVNLFVGKCNDYLDSQKYVEQVYGKAMHASKWNMDDYIDSLRNELQILSNIVKFNISYAKKHAKNETSPIAGNQKCMDALRSLSEGVKNMEREIDVAISLAEILYEFRCLACGFNPEYDSMELEDALMYAEMDAIKALEDAKMLVDA